MTENTEHFFFVAWGVGHVCLAVILLSTVQMMRISINQSIVVVEEPRKKKEIVSVRGKNECHERF